MKKSFSVISEILRPFVKTLTPDQMHFLCNTDNVRQPFQMQLSGKLKIFSELFTAFLKSTFNFKPVERKDESRS